MARSPPLRGTRRVGQRPIRSSESSRAGRRRCPPAGRTAHDGVASEGNAGEQWTANEAARSQDPRVRRRRSRTSLRRSPSRSLPQGDHEQALVWDEDPGATEVQAGDLDRRSRGSCPQPYLHRQHRVAWSCVRQRSAGRIRRCTAMCSAAPCGTHWSSIASEVQRRAVGRSGAPVRTRSSGYGLPACPPPEATGPPVGEQVSTIPRGRMPRRDQPDQSRRRRRHLSPRQVSQCHECAGAVLECQTTRRPRCPQQRRGLGVGLHRQPGSSARLLGRPC